ncbi:2,3-bisphosphoglycerate-independent phosphoglycerate mutase [Spongiibacter taiwanensis]|uniref:2,3-bisphosphoglycerate-independent phosphoglycerate mutase n=1 Tax=Spongiibacter taiwanensis TaxID=1748242 RepID=UPI0020365F2E|nr:2,3-bisphosphoglycerate-independent phosphoglycerate mutase [Spongiibacter taiwanensis]USA44715.1 2,3-bisphosphoglycerate-independent phosphoglycerate mutase [Spongiibacter taiwanensis]
MTDSQAQSPAKKPVVLIILDGFGYREAPEDNAIFHAATPTWDALWQSAPRTLISGSGLDVGLPDGQMGNSEVGHMSLGAGRIIYQSITRIDKEIADGDFFNNAAYTDAVDQAVASDKAVHILGLLSPGGVHSHEDHMVAMIELAAKRGAKKVYLHAFLDGRDTPPRSAKASLEKVDAKFAELDCGRLASMVGRYYAMDRDNRWDRVQKAYNLLRNGAAEYRFDNASAALDAAYGRDENDEFVSATVIAAEGQEAATISDGDAVIFMNFRADRAREITRAFVDKDFDGFDRGPRPALSSYVMTTQYADDIDALVAYQPDNISNSYGELMEKAGKTQLRIAETEKYAHVTFFFSGGREALYEGEERKLIPSPDVATYDLKPEMSAPQVTDELVAAIRSGTFDTIICNYANGDMVGHTGVFDAAVKAVEALDGCLKRVTEAVLEVGGQCLITADHGNCEQMQDYDAGQAHTQHTTELVPLVYVGDRNVSLKASGGRLADIAPTMLALMGLPQPPEMTGENLVTSR